jgi:hypothetical protein
MIYTKLNLVIGDEISARAMNTFETISESILVDTVDHTHDDTYLSKTLADTGYWSTVNGKDCNADMLQGFHASSLIGMAASLPIGTMACWDGILGNIPAGWRLADGNSGTLDMRNYFPMGSSTTHAIGTTYGANSVTPGGDIYVAAHALTIDEVPAHHHWVNEYYHATGTQFQAVYGGGTESSYDITPSQIAVTASTVGGGGHIHDGSYWSATAPSSNLPQYYALYIIEKIS